MYTYDPEDFMEWAVKNRHDAKKHYAALTAERDALKECLRDMKKVTAVLGKGVGHIATPNNFFALWNDTEVQANRLLAKLERGDE